MKVAVHVIKERILPPVDDELAKKAGNFENLEKMREAITQSYTKSREDLHRSAAQKRLLDDLLAQLDFPLPPSVVEQHLDQMVEDFVNQMERRGQEPGIHGQDPRRTQDRNGPPGPRKWCAPRSSWPPSPPRRNCPVSPQEMDAYFYRLSSQTGQDVILLKRYYEDNNLIAMVRDKLLADKAADFLYANALVNKVPPADPQAAPLYGVRD